MRADGAHKASRVIADSCATAVFEDLDVSAMIASAKGTEEEPGRNVRQKSGLNREIAARGWYQLQVYTAYKAAELARVPAPYSSLTCPRCGHVSAKNRPSRDVFRCSECAFTGHADVAAAINLAARHKAATAGAQPGEARETCEPVGAQPVNAQPSPDREPRGGQSGPGERSRPRQEACPAANVTGPLVPAAWGIGTARKNPQRRRSRHRRARSPGNGHHDG